MSMQMNDEQQMTSMEDTKTGKGDDQKPGVGQACQAMSSMSNMSNMAESATAAEQLAPLAMMAL